MKKRTSNLLSVLALICAGLSLAVSFLTLTSVPEDQSHLIDDLYRENQELRDRIDQLNTRLESLQTEADLQDWTLSAAPWPDSTGADITLTATPAGNASELSAVFLVMLEGQEIVSVPCRWDGATLIATASLDAADGYGYYCLLTVSGESRQLPLTTPDNPIPDIPVYLLSSLDAYCSLAVNDWGEAEGELILTDAYAQVQLPRICAEENLQILSADLVLRLDGTDTARVPITLSPSEVSGSFQQDLTDLRLPMGQLEEGQNLELYLEVSLSDGRNLTVFGISWYLEEGKISSAVG